MFYEWFHLELRFGQVEKVREPRTFTGREHSPTVSKEKVTLYLGNIAFNDAPAPAKCRGGVGNLYHEIQFTPVNYSAFSQDQTSSCASLVCWPTLSRLFPRISENRDFREGYVRASLYRFRRFALKFLRSMEMKVCDERFSIHSVFANTRYAMGRQSAIMKHRRVLTIDPSLIFLLLNRHTMITLVIISDQYLWRLRESQFRRSTSWIQTENLVSRLKRNPFLR